MPPQLFVIASAICFATTGTAQALGAPGASSVAVGAMRLLVGGAGLIALAAWAARRRGEPLRLPVNGTTLVAALGVVAYQPTFFLAVRETGVAVGTLVALGSAPVFTGALGWLTGQGFPGRRWITATGLACVGLAVLSTGGGGGTISASGVALAAGAGASYAVYALAIKRLLDAGTPLEPTLAAVFGAAGLLLAPVLLVVPVGWVATPRGVVEVLWLGLVATTLAYAWFARGLRHLPAAHTATLTLAEPLTAAALGVLLLDESLTLATVTGAVLLVAGLVVLAAAPRTVPEPALAGPLP